MKKTTYLVFALILIAGICKAQIPNSGFENWTNMGAYDNPDSWSCLNNLTASVSTFTCAKGTPGSPGASYLQLTSKTVTGMGVVPGIAVCGTINTTTMQAEGGFPFTSRPANLTGNWQHMIFGSSQGYIDVQLTRWDGSSSSRVPVASAHYVLTGMAMSWASFTIPLTYADGNNPDSCLITLSASGSTPTASDYLWVDNLGFSGTVTGIENNENFVNDVSIFHNSFDASLTISINLKQEDKVSIQLLDLMGRMVREKNLGAVQGENKQTVSVAGIARGSYFVKVIAGSRAEVKKIVIE